MIERQFFSEGSTYKLLGRPYGFTAPQFDRSFFINLIKQHMVLSDYHLPSMRIYLKGLFFNYTGNIRIWTKYLTILVRIHSLTCIYQRNKATHHRHDR